MATIQIKRIYDDPSNTDGYRVLVDRLWPRGVKKESAGVDVWLKEVAPSAALRKWFDHKEERWPEFSKKYKAELKDNAAFGELKKIIKEYKTITLLYGAKDEQHNQAVVLSGLLKS